MERTLITFLGIQDYSETVYSWEGIGEHRTAHVAAALAGLWKADRVVVLATNLAETRNRHSLEDSLALTGGPPPRFQRLPDGRTEEELWEQFQVIREAVQTAVPGDVLIDITHGFRAQPFFAGAVLSVLRAADRLTAGQIDLVYGEYRKDEAPSPIWDLSLFIELTDWAQALGLFLKTGVAGPLVELAEVTQRRESRRASASKNRRLPGFWPLVKAIRCFADDLSTVRVASIITGYEQDDLKRAKALGSARGLLAAIRQCRDEVAARLPPLALVLDQLSESVGVLPASSLDGEDGQRAQYALARFYLSLGRYPEAAAVIREAVISSYAQDQRAVEVNSADYDACLRKEAEEIFHDNDDHHLAISELRNDIEHAGFRSQPLSAQALQRRIEQLLLRYAGAEFQEATSRTPSAEPSRPARTLLVTRHAGAAEWAAQQGVTVDKTVSHLDTAEIHPGDTVVGTLPVHLAAEVCSRGARYLHLALDLPAESRGVELTAEDMARLGARLVEYRVYGKPDRKIRT